MSPLLAVAVYLVVHVVSGYMLRASGTWKVLFAPVLPAAPEATPDPLRVAPRGWIENHSFWDLHPDEDEAEQAQPDEDVFWGPSHHDVG